MKSIKFHSVFLLFLFTLLTLSACGPPKYITPDIPEWSASIIKTDDHVYVRIAYVDGKKATGRLKGQPAEKFPDTVIVSPGYHSITPCYITPTDVTYGAPLQFYTQANESYILRHKIKWNKTIKFWIEHKGIDITTE